MTRRVKHDFATVLRLLHLNLGRGFYSYSGFKEAPEVRSDACRNWRFAGGGWASRCGRYNFWQYGARALKKPIDFLEGDTAVLCARQMGHLWKHCIVPFGIDNSAFQQSAAKGRSKVIRLNDLVREMFSIMLYFTFIFRYFWLSSEDNEETDHLSRNREAKFLASCRRTGF